MQIECICMFFICIIKQETKNIMKKYIDEDQLGCLNSLDYKNNLDEISLSDKEEMAKDMPNVKFGKGLYKVNNHMYMSIWAYKNEYDICSNYSSDNYSDAISISKSGLATDLVIVNTHSPSYPRVRGYLRSSLDSYYN